MIFADIWSAWAKNYASPVSFPAKPSPLKWQLPAATQNWHWSTGDEIPARFTLRNSALSIPGNCKQYEYRVIELNQEFPAGIYDFEFVLENDSAEKLNSIGIFLLGKTGKQTLLFNANGNMKTKNINCFILEPFSGIILKKMQNLEAECIGLRKIIRLPTQTSA